MFDFLSKRAVCGLLLCAVLFFSASSSPAVPINYIVEGDLSLSYGEDVYSLDGAHFVWTIGADTNIAPVPDTVEYYKRGSYYGWMAFYQSVSSYFTITGRDSGASDIVVDSALPLIQTVNYPTDSPYYDIFEIRGTTIQSGELSGLIMSSWSLNNANSYYLDFKLASLPNHVNSNESIFPYWGKFDYPVSYIPSNWSIKSEIPVPEPSTVLLLGSGLAGLSLYARKRKKLGKSAGF